MTYKVQIDDVVRDATPDETAKIDDAHQQNEIAKQAAIDAVTAAQSARAKLAALGLTEAEIEALVG